MRLLLLFVICHFPPPSVTLSKDSCRRNESIDIHIIGFFPCTDPNDRRSIPVDNCDGIERIPIMKLALEEINERCNVLPGYRLVVDYANSAVSYYLYFYPKIPQPVSTRARYCPDMHACISYMFELRTDDIASYWHVLELAIFCMLRL